MTDTPAPPSVSQVTDKKPASTDKPSAKPPASQPAAPPAKTPAAQSSASAAVESPPKIETPKTETPKTETSKPDTPPQLAAATPTPPKTTPAPAAKDSKPAQPSAPEDNEVRLLVKEKTFKNEGKVLRVSYDDIDLIKVLNLKKPTPNVMDLMPGWLKSLEGKRVRMRGFMYPPYQQEGIDHFVFCRDTGACCFGPNPIVYYMIDVRMKPGTTTDYIENRPFDVEGTFRIKTAVLEGTGEVYELYHLEQASVVRK
ncbi:MAG: DUF3299 domain-containing protein [Planctomycetales bacterium]